MSSSSKHICLLFFYEHTSTSEVQLKNTIQDKFQETLLNSFILTESHLYTGELLSKSYFCLLNFKQPVSDLERTKFNRLLIDEFGICSKPLVIPLQSPDEFIQICKEEGITGFEL